MKYSYYPKSEIILSVKVSYDLEEYTKIQLVHKEGEIKFNGLKIFGKQIIPPIHYKKNLYNYIDSPSKITNKPLDYIKKHINELHKITHDDYFNLKYLVGENNKIFVKPSIQIRYKGRLHFVTFLSSEDLYKWLNESGSGVKEYMEKCSRSEITEDEYEWLI